MSATSNYLDPSINRVIAMGTINTAPFPLVTIDGTMSYSTNDPKFVLLKDFDETIDLRRYDFLYFDGEIVEIASTPAVVPGSTILKVRISGTFTGSFTDEDINITYGLWRPGYPEKWSVYGEDFLINGVQSNGGYSFSYPVRLPVVIDATFQVFVSSGLYSTAVSGSTGGGTDPQKESISWTALRSESLGTVWVGTIYDEVAETETEIWKDSSWATIADPGDTYDFNAINVAGSGNSIVLNNANSGAASLVLGFIGTKRLLINNESNTQHATVELVTSGGSGNLTFRVPANARNYEIELPDDIITQINFLSIGDIDNVVAVGTTGDDGYSAVVPAVGADHLLHIKALTV